MKTSENGLALIKKYEGCRLKAYALGDGKITIGWGHAEDIGKSTYKLGQAITQAKADELLVNDLKKYEAKVNKYGSYNWTQNEFDSLVSFCYNIGSIDQLTANEVRTKSVIADKMDEYISKGTKFEKGLLERRKAEQKLFLSGTSSPSAIVTSKNPYTVPQNVLRKGNVGNEVKWLQWELKQAGYDIVIDGDFGKKTDDIIRKFQELYNLTVDGVVGINTVNMLLSK